MPVGRPCKQARNTAGLKKHDTKAQTTSVKGPLNDREALDEEWQPNICFDSTKLITKAESDSGAETDNEETFEWEDLEDEYLQEHLVDMAKAEGDDPTDEDWLPSKLKKKRKIEKIPGTHQVITFYGQS